MGDQCCIDRPRERMQEEINDILRICGPQNSLTTDEDVVLFAVDELHRKVLMSRAAELDRLLVWRTNLEVQHPKPSRKKSFQLFLISEKKPVLVSAAGSQGNSPEGERPNNWLPRARRP